jgi:hypothetical protein
VAELLLDGARRGIVDLRLRTALQPVLDECLAAALINRQRPRYADPDS